MQGQDPIPNEYDTGANRAAKNDQPLGLPGDAVEIKDVLKRSTTLWAEDATIQRKLFFEHGIVLTIEDAHSATENISNRAEEDVENEVDQPCRFVLPDQQGEHLLKGAESALLKAEEAVLPFKLNKELKAATSVDAQITRLQEQIEKAGPPKYARAIKAICHYATVLEAVANLSSLDAAWRASYLSCAADNLAAFMSVVGEACKEVSENNFAFSCEKKNAAENAILKIVRTKDYLNHRILTMDTNQARRIQRVQEARLKLTERIKNQDLVEPNDSSNGISGEITSLGQLLGELAQRTTDLLPNDAAIFFLSKKGTLLESAGDNGGTFLLAIDIIRLREGGLGPKGAGLYRFVGQEGNIAAAVIVRPKYDCQGKPIELTRSQLNKRSYAKEIVEVLGSAPPITVELKPGEPQEMQVKPGMSFGNLLKHFRAPMYKSSMKD